MNPTYDFSSQVALVTGAGAGMGLDTARAFAAAGAAVVLADVNEQALRPATDEPAESFDGVPAINLRGVWACMKHELRPMRAQRSGAIVNCSSLGGLVGLPGRASYHGPKHAVLGFTKSAGVEYAPRGI